MREEGPLDEELPRRGRGMDRDLHPAGTGGILGLPPDRNTTTSPGEALTDREMTPSEPELPGEALPDPETTTSEPTQPGEALPDPAATTAPLTSCQPCALCAR